MAKAKQCRFLKVLLWDKTADIGFNARLVYSYFVYCGENRRSLSAKKAAKELGISRNAVRRAITTLLEHGLLSDANSHLTISKPPAGTFIPRSYGGSLWFQQIAYVRVRWGEHQNRKDSLSYRMRYASVYCFLLYHPRPKSGWSVNYLSALLGMDTKTIKTILTHFEEDPDCLKLQHTPQGFSVEHIKDYWPKRAKKTARNRSD